MRCRHMIICIVHFEFSDFKCLICFQYNWKLRKQFRRDLKQVGIYCLYLDEYLDLDYLDKKWRHNFIFGRLLVYIYITHY